VLRTLPLWRCQTADWALYGQVTDRRWQADLSFLIQALNVRSVRVATIRTELDYSTDLIHGWALAR
jgi:hypothetical protein